MSRKNNFGVAKELDEMNEKYYMKDDFLGVDILTMPNKIDANRGTMFGNMIQQAVCITNAEPPRLFSRYENQVGKYSSSYYKSKTDYEVIAKIKKFDNSDNYYTFIVYDKETGKYDIINRTPVEHLTESYCYLNVNNEIDSYDRGDTIQKNKILHHSTNFDDYGNYSYGLNAKACYLIYNDTIEDGIVASEDFVKRMSFTYLHNVTISVNTNDLLVNIYGDNKTYKSFPDIGEETSGKILAARRRIDYDNALFDLKDEQLRVINYTSDTRFYSKGTVVDINIYSNTSIEDLKANKYNDQLVYYLEQQNKYYSEVKEVLDEIIEDDGDNFSEDLAYFYNRVSYILDPEVTFKDEKSDFDNIKIKISVLENNPLHVGSKICTRCGAKGVISKIVPVEEMPVAEDGTRAEIVLNAIGVCNRLNPAQLYETEILFIADNIQKDMRKMSLNDAKNFYFEFLKDVNKDQYEHQYNFYKKLSKKDKVNFVKELLEKPIRIHQPPFWGNLNLEQLGGLYDKYGYKPYKIFIDGEEVENRVIISDIYMLRLKHEPLSKYSVRSTSFINLKNTPSKSLAYKKFEEPYSKTPIRIGEMELMNLLLTKKAKLQSKFNSLYSNNDINRMHMNKVLLTDNNILDLDTIETPSNENSSRTILDVFFKSLSLRLKEITKKK
jgi:DNA-directed RNA polymerase beta subunit